MYTPTSPPSTWSKSNLCCGHIILISPTVLCIITSVSDDIKSRTGASNRLFYSLWQIFGSRNMSKVIEINICKKMLKAGRGHSVKIDNISIEKVEQFKYLGTTLTDQNSIQEEIKSRLKLGNACYYSVQNLLSSRLLCKNFKIKIYRTIILPVVLYGCQTWSLTLREERRLRVFEKGVEESIWT